MQYTGQKPPTYIVVLFVTFFPLQGFFNLVVYMFPRFLRYYEEGIPLTQAFERRRSSLLSSFVTSARNSISKRRSSQVSSAVVNEIVENENDHDHEADAGAGSGSGEDANANADEKNMIEEGTIVENGKLDGENDAIDELERIVDC